MATKRPKTLRPVRPNEGLQLAYRAKLLNLIDDMHASVLYWITAAYRKTPPEMAQDASPARTLQEAAGKLARRWQKQFDQAAPALAQYFATEAQDRSDVALMGALKKGGFAVKFNMTRESNDVLQATIGEQVGLIKSIAQQHLGGVEGVVMRGVSSGRDLQTITAEIEKRYAVTKRRAELIARDQSNKATSNMTAARQLALGIEEGIWMHSAGGKEPRPSHVAASGKKFNLREGMHLDGKWIKPGEEINCRCVWRPVLPGF